MIRTRGVRPLQLILPAGLLLIGWILFANTGPLMDEALHGQQISRYLDSDFTRYTRLEMLPGMHALYALWAKFIGSSGLPSQRFFSILWAFALFLFVSASAPASSRLSKSWQVFTLPYLVPFLFLVYTDIPALVFLLATHYCIEQRRFTLGSFSFLLAMLVRQNHFTWLLFFTYRIWKETGSVRGVILFSLPALSLLLALLCYGGLTLHVPAGVAEVSYHLGNVMFLLASLPLLFLPLVIEAASDMVKFCRHKFSLIFLSALVLLTFGLFAAPHPFNKFAGHIRTYAFFAIEEDLFLRFAFSLLAGMGACFWVTKLKEKHWLLSVSTLLALLPLKLIEVRYLFPSLVFFVLLKEEGEAPGKRSQLLYAGSLSVFFLFATARGWCFW